MSASFIHLLTFVASADWEKSVDHHTNVEGKYQEYDNIFTYRWEMIRIFFGNGEINFAPSHTRYLDDEPRFSWNTINDVAKSVPPPTSWYSDACDDFIGVFSKSADIPELLRSLKMSKLEVGEGVAKYPAPATAMHLVTCDQSYRQSDPFFSPLLLLRAMLAWFSNAKRSSHAQRLRRLMSYSIASFKVA